MSIENINDIKNTFPEKNDKVQIYANKLDKIAESFGIAESTVTELGKEFDKIQSSITTKTETTVVSDQNQNDKNMDLLLKYEILAEDFKMVRSNLRNLIDNSNLLIQNLQTNLIMEGDLNPDSINSFVNVGNLINSSMKMLLSNYNDLLTIESKIKARTTPPPSTGNNPLPTIGGGNNIIIATNTADLIASKLTNN